MIHPHYTCFNVIMVHNNICGEKYTASIGDYTRDKQEGIAIIA